jgi:hypothetical protein
MFRYYTFIGKKISYEVGHNAMAAMIYLMVYILFAVQIVTGFAMYSQYSPSGFWNTLAGPLPAGRQPASAPDYHGVMAASRLRHQPYLQRLADGRERAQRHQQRHRQRLQIHRAEGPLTCLAASSDDRGTGGRTKERWI